MRTVSVCTKTGKFPHYGASILLTADTFQSLLSASQDYAPRDIRLQAEPDCDGNMFRKV